MQNWISTGLSSLKKGWNHHQPEEDIPIFLHLYWGNIQEMNELHPQEQCIDFFFHDPFSIKQNPNAGSQVFLGYTRNGDVHKQN